MHAALAASRSSADRNEAAQFWRDRGGLYDNEMQRWHDGIFAAAEKLLHCGQQVVHVGDRELGRYNMLAWMAYLNMNFVVRASLDQLRTMVGKLRLTLPDALAEAPWSGSVEAELASRPENRSGKAVKSHPSRRSRKAVLSFRSQAVELTRPNHKESKESYNPLGQLLPDNLSISVVEVRELNPPAGEPAVHWILVTTLPVNSVAAQLDVIRCYRRRWIIEEFFRALKQGCKFERRQIESAQGLLVALAMFLPVAWSLLRLQTAATETPNARWQSLFAKPVLTAIRRL
ncbi:MAG: transposase, partial [Deltaproteobacteria bacterium]|nr:transposase [Deltaproteobacteria bacterium]